MLAKASKIIPVMLMGKLVSKNKYEYYEYVVAILISIGMTFFLMGATEEKNSKYDPSTTSTKVILVDGSTPPKTLINKQHDLHYLLALYPQYKT